MTEKEENLILKGIIAKLTFVLKLKMKQSTRNCFEAAMGGSTRELITTNTNNKSKSTRIPSPKVATQQKRDSLVATSGRNEGEEFPNRSTVSTSQNVTEHRYQTKSASGIPKPRKLEDCFLFKYNDSEEKFENCVFFKKDDATKCRGRETHIGTCC